jgi:serine O-acetyltransferase
VGNPARIIQAEQDAKREEVASKMGFSAYGVTQNDDPLSQAMRGLIDNAAGQEHQIAMIWKALDQLCAHQQVHLPRDAATHESFEADKLNQLIGK